ncbi:MAG: GNAT family N-acetyltransferase, partial [Chloroflexota bacterium]
GAAAGRPLAGLLATTTTDQPEAVSFLENRGFKSQLKVVETKIELDAVDFAEYDQIISHVSKAGIKIRTLAKLIPIDTDYKTKLYDLEWVLRQDEPHTEAPKRAPFEVFEEEYFNQPSFDPENWIIATHRNDYIGWSILYPHPSSDAGMHTSLTVVDRPYRRQGVGRAIKYVSFRRAKSLGKAWMTTSNEESNPMLQLNLSLGYQPQRTRLEYKLESL